MCFAAGPEVRELREPHTFGVAAKREKTVISPVSQSNFTAQLAKQTPTGDLKGAGVYLWYRFQSIRTSGRIVNASVIIIYSYDNNKSPPFTLWGIRD